MGYQLEGELFNAKLMCSSERMPLLGELDFNNTFSKEFLKQITRKVASLSLEKLVFVGGR